MHSRCGRDAAQDSVLRRVCKFSGDENFIENGVCLLKVEDPARTQGSATRRQRYCMVTHKSSSVTFVAMNRGLSYAEVACAYITKVTVKDLDVAVDDLERVELVRIRVDAAHKE